MAGILAFVHQIAREDERRPRSFTKGDPKMNACPAISKGACHAPAGRGALVGSVHLDAPLYERRSCDMCSGVCQAKKRKQGANAAHYITPKLFSLLRRFLLTLANERRIRGHRQRNDALSLRRRNMTNAAPTYTTRANAVRGARRRLADLVADLDNATIFDRFVRAEGDAFVLVEPVADVDPADMTVDQLAAELTDETPAADETPADADAPKRKTHILKGVELRRRSDEPMGATAAVRAFFDAMRDECDADNVPVRRRDFIAAAVEGGYAYYTARTQYQRWATMNAI